MARKPVPRSLPGLREIHPHFQGIPRAAHRTATLVGLLRRTIRTVRKPHAIPFYPMQDVVGFFGVSMKTVQSAYKQLQMEGLISSQRGSQTTLPGSRPQPRRPVRGVVAVVIWLPGFRLCLDWQFFFTRLEDELGRHRLVADLILYEQGEEMTDPFMDRIFRHYPDWTIWLFPDPVHRQLLEQLQDTGLRTVVIGDRPLKRLPGQKYFLSWERALQTGLEAWRRDGVRKVVVPGLRADSVSLTHVAEPVLRRSGLAYRFYEIQHVDFVTAMLSIERLPLDARTGILFDDDISFGYQFRNVPASLIDLFRRHRAIVGRPLDMPPDYLRGVRVDALVPNWRRMAQRIAADIASESILTRADMVQFEAQWRPRIELNDFLKCAGG